MFCVLFIPYVDCIYLRGRKFQWGKKVRPSLKLGTFFKPEEWHMRRLFRTLSKALYFSPLNNAFGLSMYRSIIDFLKIFALPSRIIHWVPFLDNNTCVLSFAPTAALALCTAWNTRLRLVINCLLNRAFIFT